MKISIADTIGLHCIDPADGDVIYDLLVRELNFRRIELDFTGVKTITGSFLNSCIGRLYGKFEAEFIDIRLSIAGMDKTDQDLLLLVKKTAIRYFGMDEASRRALQSAERELLESLRS